MTAPLRKFFHFYGAKWEAGRYYPVPIHDTIVEPFAGSAGYSTRHYHKKVVLVEKDPVIAATWRYLLRVTPEEILSLPDLKDGETVDDLDVCEEPRLLIGWWLNAGTSRPRKSPSSWMRSGHRPNGYWGPVVRARIASQVDYIRHWTLVEGDYHGAPDVEATWFIDPPYQKAGKHYQLGNSTLDYSKLAGWCKTRKGQVMVCENTGADWMDFRYWRSLRATSSQGVSKRSEEAMWTNFEMVVS